LQFSSSFDLLALLFFTNQGRRRNFVYTAIMELVLPISITIRYTIPTDNDSGIRVLNRFLQ